MGHSTIFFNGQLISRPGSYSETDTSALETVGLGATGIVALLGLSEGGRPWNAVVDPNNDLQTARSTGVASKLFRSGDLLEMTPPLLSPSEDDDIPAGAQNIVYVKVNPAAQAAITLNDALSANSVTFTARDWGQFTNQITVLVETGSTGGKKVTVVFEETTEVFDDLGATAKFTLQYGADAARVAAGLVAQRSTADKIATAFEVQFERDDLGQDDLVTTQAVGGASLEIVSDNVGDTTQTVTVFGLDGSGVPQSQVATLNGTTPVAVPGTWNLETAAVLSAAAVGVVTVRNAAGAVVVFDIPAATLEEGRAVVDIPVDDVPATPTTTIESSGASTQQVIIRGLAQNTSALVELLTLTGTTPVPLTGAFSRITSIELADVEVAETLTIKGRSMNALFTAENTLEKLRAKVNAEPDFALVSLIGNPKEFLVTDLEDVAAVNVREPATGSFFAVLADVIAGVNLSTLVSAAEAAPGNLPPANTAAPVFLAGGHEGDPVNPSVPTALQSDWIGAIDLLKRVRVNTLVPASVDASIHALIVAHLAEMGGRGRSERDGVVAPGPQETKAALKTRALDINSRHVRLWANEVDRFNFAGERVTQDPKFGAAIIAGMQAGSPPGTSLVDKSMRVLGLRQNPDWNSFDDADEMIQAGVMFGELVPNQGVKVVRNNTTHLSSSNLVFTQAHVNEAANIATFEFRTRMGLRVGKKQFSGTRKAAEGEAIGVLDELISGESPVITEYKNLLVTIVGDVIEVEIEMAPILSTTFVKNTIHLVLASAEALAA